MRLVKIKKYSTKISKFLFNLRNKNYVRKNSINTKKINFLDHEKWFKNFLKKENILYLMKEKNTFIGYIRMQNYKNFFYVSWAVLKKFQKMGYAKKGLVLSTKIKKYKYKALIKRGNFASICIAEKTNFKLEYLKKNICYYSK